MGMRCSHREPIALASRWYRVATDFPPSYPGLTPAFPEGGTPQNIPRHERFVKEKDFIYICLVPAGIPVRMNILIKAFLLCPRTEIWTISKLRERRYKRSCLPYMPFGHISGHAWGIVLSQFRKSRSSVLIKRKKFPRFSHFINLPSRELG